MIIEKSIIGKSLVLLSLFFLLALAIHSPCRVSASTDPVTVFIATADSLAASGGDALLSPYVSAHAILVGAAVGRLLDAAFQIGEAGDAAAEKENVDFAEKLAVICKARTGSTVPLELVEIYINWKPAQRRLRAKAMQMEAEAAEARCAGDLDKAVELYLGAQKLYRKIDDRRSLAVNLESLGVMHWHRGDWDAVEESYREALAARREIEDRILEGRTLNGLGSKHYQTGQYETAVGYYQQAVGLRRRTGDFGGLCTSLTYLGNVYLRIGKLVDARDRFAEALEVVKGSGNTGQMIDLLTSIANANTEMGRLQSANRAYREAIELCTSVDEPLREAHCRLNLADNLREMDRFKESLSELETVSGLLERVNDPLVPVMLHRNRGLTYLGMGELDRARNDFIVLLDQSEQLEDPLYSIEALINLGFLYRDLGAYEQGLSSAERAWSLAEKAGNFRLLRDAVCLTAILQHLIGLHGESLRNWEWVLERDRIDGFEANVIDDRLSMFSVLADSGRTGEARKGFREIWPEVRDSGRADLQWIFHLGVAHTYESENPDSAAFHYDRAFDSLGRLRAGIGGAEIQTGYLANRRWYYEEVARYYAGLGGEEKWINRAFHTMERAKGRGLLDLIEASILVESSPREEALLDSLYRLDRDSDGYAEEERRLRGEYLNIRAKRFENAVGPLGRRMEIAEIRDVQAVLPKGTVMLEYALGDTVSLLWAIDRKGFSQFEIPDRASIRGDVERLRDAVARPGPGDEQLRAASRDLYRRLVQPAAERMKEARRLVIVPDGVLFDLPFEILLTYDPSGEVGWEAQPYLTRDYATVYCPSASIYVRLKTQKGKKKYERELLALGDPDFSPYRDLTDASLKEIVPLPSTRSEVFAIGAYVKEDRKRIFVGADASEANLKEELRTAGSPHIVHLATHGQIDPVEPISSRVVLSPGAGGEEDGLLHTLEILSLPLDAGLVVVSACESARWRISRGEGVVGLSRAFVASGARGVVASLWAVSDVSTAELMKIFYERLLKKRKSACESFQSARLTLMEDPAYAHPFYWSPFVVIGTEKTPW